MSLPCHSLCKCGGHKHLIPNSHHPTAYHKSAFFLQENNISNEQIEPVRHTQHWHNPLLLSDEEGSIAAITLCSIYVSERRVNIERFVQINIVFCIMSSSWMISVFFLPSSFPEILAPLNIMSLDTWKNPNWIDSDVCAELSICYIVRRARDASWEFSSQKHFLGFSSRHPYSWAHTLNMCAHTHAFFFMLFNRQI